MSEIPSDDLINAIMLGDYLPDYKKIEDGKLVHYTSAEAAFRILDSKSVLLRDARLMNDYRELQHGLTCLIENWGSIQGQAFRGWLDTMQVDLANRLSRTFDAHSDGLLRATYMMSLSRHRANEDVYGRLSMWRAYGGDAGVALVLNNTAFLSSTDELSIFSAPVRYLDGAAFSASFEGWTRSVMAGEALLRMLPPEDLFSRLFHVLRMFVLCTKHPGFREELEWRIFYTPTLDGPSDWLTPEWDLVRGVPQHYHRIALRDDLARGVTGVAIPTLIHKIIVGPCAHPEAIAETLLKKLTDAGFNLVPGTVTISDIPLRR